METKEREAYRKDNDMNEFDKRAEAYMRTVMNNDGDVFTRADLYEYIMDAWKAGMPRLALIYPCLVVNHCQRRKIRNHNQSIRKDMSKREAKHIVWPIGLCGRISRPEKSRTVRVSLRMGSEMY